MTDVVFTQQQVDNDTAVSQGAARDFFYAYRVLARNKMLTN